MLEPIDDGLGNLLITKHHSALIPINDIYAVYFCFADVRRRKSRIKLNWYLQRMNWSFILIGFLRKIFPSMLVLWKFVSQKLFFYIRFIVCTILPLRLAEKSRPTNQKALLMFPDSYGSGIIASMFAECKEIEWEIVD